LDYWTNGNALPAIALELANEVDDLLQLLARDFGEHRQRQDLALIAGCVRKLFGTLFEPAIRGQERQRSRIS
jgi:hypothetical protein